MQEYRRRLSRVFELYQESSLPRSLGATVFAPHRAMSDFVAHAQSQGFAGFAKSCLVLATPNLRVLSTPRCLADVGLAWAFIGMRTAVFTKPLVA